MRAVPVADDLRQRAISSLVIGIGGAALGLAALAALGRLDRPGPVGELLTIGLTPFVVMLLLARSDRARVRRNLVARVYRVDDVYGEPAGYAWAPATSPSRR